MYKDILDYKRYLKITESLGPSEQLIQFMNLNKTINDSLGLESFDSFSLDAKHEILKKEFTKIIEENIALEGLGKDVLTIALTGAFFVTALALARGSGKIIIGGLKLTSILTGKIYEKISSTKVLPYTYFELLKKQAENYLEAETLALSYLPKNIKSTEEWKVYYSDFFNFGNEDYEELITDEDIYQDLKKYSTLVTYDKSGWTADNFQDATKWFVDYSKRFVSLREKYASKIKQVDAYRNKVLGNTDIEAEYDEDNPEHELMWYLVRSMGDVLYDVPNSVKHMQSLLDKVGHHFKAQ